jgi:hypothetical protein
MVLLEHETISRLQGIGGKHSNAKNAGEETFWSKTVVFLLLDW